MYAVALGTRWLQTWREPVYDNEQWSVRTLGTRSILYFMLSDVNGVTAKVLGGKRSSFLLRGRWRDRRKSALFLA